MDPIYKPLTQEEKNKLEAKGYQEYEYFYFPKWTDPDEFVYKLTSALLIGVGFYGRHLARKNFTPSFLFSINICLVPMTWFYALKFKHVDIKMDQYRRRRTFNENLEFYPVTRRAWKRALSLREREMKEIKMKVENL